MPGEWWEDFFDETWARLLGSLWTEEENRRQAEHAAGLLDLDRGDRVLDVPCGDGRLGLELARQGYRVTGIDLAPALIDRADRAARGRRLPAEWAQGDMRALPLHGPFDAALCWWGSFGYFDEQGDAAFVQELARVLGPRKPLLIDLPLAETLLPHYRPRDWTRVGDALVLEDRSYDLDTGRLEVDWTFVVDGTQSTRHSSIRLYAYRELRDLLQREGFEDVRAFGPDGEPLVAPGPHTRAHVLARRAWERP